LRALMTRQLGPSPSNLRGEVREKLIDFVLKCHLSILSALPTARAELAEVRTSGSQQLSEDHQHPQ